MCLICHRTLTHVRMLGHGDCDLKNVTIFLIRDCNSISLNTVKRLVLDLFTSIRQCRKRVFSSSLNFLNQTRCNTMHWFSIKKCPNCRFFGICNARVLIISIILWIHQSTLPFRLHQIFQTGVHLKMTSKFQTSDSRKCKILILISHKWPYNRITTSSKLE